MEPEVVTGLFALGGVALGSAATQLFGLLSSRMETKKEDDRRWLVDRRSLYATYLGHCNAALREIYDVGCTMSDSWHHDQAHGHSPSAEDFHAERNPKLDALRVRVSNDLPPALGEVQLMAKQPVSDLARSVFESLQLCLPDSVLEDSDSTRAAHKIAEEKTGSMRNAMRAELGVAEESASVQGND